MIFIPFGEYKGVSGPATFMLNLKAYMDGKGAPYREHYEPGDAIFFPIYYDVLELKRIKNNRGRIIQRLDGVYYPSYHSRRYTKHNRPIRTIYRDYADVVVFQSDYSRLQCREILGERNAAADQIIHNGVDPAIFFPDNRPMTVSEPIEFVVTGNFRLPETLKPILNALDSLRGKFAFRLHICGPVKSKLAGLYAGKPYIVAHGAQDLRYVAALLRKSHVFLFSNINPPCPNSVLEAAASGLPIVSFDSGALAELLPFSRDLLAHVSSDVIQKPRDFHYELLTEKILLAVENLAEFQINSLNHANDFAFSKCGEAYLKVFSDVEGCHFLDASRDRRITSIGESIQRFMDFVKARKVV